MFFEVTFVGWLQRLKLNTSDYYLNPKVDYLFTHLSFLKYWLENKTNKKFEKENNN